MNVRDFGVYGDGVHDDCPAIQAVLDKNDGIVMVPEGTYKINGTLQILPNTRLVVHPAAHLFFADGAGIDSQSFLLTNQNHTLGDCNIQIEGGIWDGNNLKNPRRPDEPGSYTGALFNFINVHSLTIKNLTVCDAEAYFICLGEVRDFKNMGNRFELGNLRPNQDGVHLGGYCENGVIRNLIGLDESTNDDLVALNADDALQRAQNLDLKRDPIRNILIENLKAESCHSFVHLLSLCFPVSDSHIKNIAGGCRCMTLYLDGCRECRVRLFDPDDPQFQDGVGDIRNVLAKNFRVYKSSSDDTAPLINLRTNTRDFVVQNFQREREKDRNLGVPTISLTDCRASRMRLEGVLPQEVEAMRLSNGFRREIFPQDDDSYNCQYDVDQKGTVQLRQNGFGVLSLNAVRD